MSIDESSLKIVENQWKQVLGVGGMGGALKSAAPVGGQGVSNILLFLALL